VEDERADAQELREATRRDRDLTNIADRHRMDLSACVPAPHDHSMRGQAVLSPVTQNDRTDQKDGSAS
jgi:hypothetical protein